ncbi:MAG: Uma2 family endonuclease, partial [Planctomycetia bacterium]
MTTALAVESSAATEPVASPDSLMETFAEVLHRLGDLPPERVLARPAPGAANEEDVLRLLDAADKRLCELVDGVLVEKTVGYAESIIACAIVAALRFYVKTNRLGIVVGADAAQKLFAGCVRIPDVSFISWDRLPDRRRPEKPIPDIVPDFTVEVLSASNTKREMERKRSDYFGGGVRLHWEVDAVSRSVAVYIAAEVKTIVQTGLLDGGDVLPG